MNKNNIQIGNKVIYRRTFLQSIGVFTGEMPFMVGEVTDIENHISILIAIIHWDGYEKEYDSKVNVNNLIQSNRKHLELV